MNYGPNVSKLIMQFAAVQAVPKGGGMADAFKFFTDSDYRMRCMEGAEVDAITAINAIISASDNPYGTDHEVIAAVLLEKIKERKSLNENKNLSS
jgi:hypothetical protein